MSRDLILGTAGHIDHGKTSLIKVLTGVDCDRLPEEKKRGITIDIGFATLTVDDVRLGIVDVPGHERFVKNMLAGATGVDLALLVVAADDSVMPQTREHFEILKLLGLRNGVIALTKCDMVDETTIEIAELEVRELVEGSFLENAPLVHTSATTGAGIDELRTTLAEVCKTIPERTGRSWFRLAIDRSFIVQGHGTVVTGSATSGSVKVGDELQWQPSGNTVRVRSLQNHDQQVDEVHRGQRSAINLAGVHHEDVSRGQELATPGYLTPSRVMTVRLTCLADMKKPIKHRLPIRFHIGAFETMGTLSLLDCDRVKPGDWALAQVFLEEQAMGVWGQPFVVRSSAGTTTLGGGQVLQPAAKKIRRRHLDILERVEQLWTGTPEERALTVAWFGGFSGFTAADLVRGANLTPDDAERIIAELKEKRDLVSVETGHGRQVLLHKDVVDELQARIMQTMKRIHDENPLMTTHDRRKMQSLLDYIGDDSLVQASVDRLIAGKQLIGNDRRIARKDFTPKLSGNQRKLKDKMTAAYEEGEFRPPESTQFTKQAGGNAANIKDLYDVCVAEGLLVHIDGDIYLHSDAEEKMRTLVRECLEQGEGATVAELRDLLGTSRKFAIPFCEYLDRVGITQRDGDLRVLAK